MWSQPPRARRFVAAAALTLSLVVTPAVAVANPSIPGSTTGPHGLIYLPIYSDGSVQAIDPATLEVVDTYYGVGDHPLVLKMTPDKTKLFVGNFGPLLSAVSVLDLTTRDVRHIWTIGAPYAVSQMSHDGRYLYSPTGFSVVHVIDTETEQMVRTLPVFVPPGPAHMELSADDSEMYVLTGAGTATKYDAYTGAVLAPPIFLNGIVPGWGALTVAGDKLYAINYLGGVTAVDVDTWTVDWTSFMPPLAGPLSATLTPDGSKLWICDIGDNNIVVMNAHTGHVDRIIDSANGSPVYAGFSADGSRAYVSTLGPSTADIPDVAQNWKFNIAFFNTPGVTGTLDVYDTATYAVTGSVQTANGPLAGVYPG